MNQARAPDESNRPIGAAEVDDVSRQLEMAITRLIRLSTEEVTVTDEQLDKLRERRHQLSAVLDGLVRFNRSGRTRATGQRRAHS